MQENSNKAIVINTLILYGRLVITMLCGLFTTRFALKALGPVDFGLYSVVASIIIFIGVINTCMLSACNRFIISSIGKGDINEINKTFNASLLIHISIAIITILFIAPIGLWYIKHFINYSGNIEFAYKTFLISILSSAISFIWVPFNAVLMAKERFYVFCGAEVIFSILKLILCYYLDLFEGNKLIAYAWIMSISIVFPGFIYIAYCIKHFSTYVKFNIVKQKSIYKSILKFSLWTSYGAFVQVGQSQCSVLLINLFFNTIMNTALSVTNYLKSSVIMLTDNMTKSISPQITKSYAAGNIDKCISLMVLISKVAFFGALLVSTPFILHSEFIINMWLGNVPEYSVMFTRIVMFTLLIGSFNKGISEYIFAVGNIKVYQLVVNTLLFIAVIVGYIVLSNGAKAYSLLFVYLIFELLAVFARQFVLHYYHKFDNNLLWKNSYLPSIKIAILSIPLFFIKGWLYPILNMALVAFIQCCLFFFIGLKKVEREKLINFLKKKIGILQ